MSGSTNTTSNTSSESVNEIPQWVQNAGQANYGLAQQVASQPLQQYQGQTVAGVAPQQQQALNLAANSGSVGQGALQASQAGYLNTLGQTPQQINPAQLSQQNLQPYMNPYTQSVINASLPVMQQNLALSQNQQQNQANSANAYGGSRQAIQQGVTQAQGALGMGQMAAGLNQANFAQAQAGAQSDVTAQNAAMAANQQAALSQGALANQASGGLGTLATQQLQNNIGNFGMTVAAGGLEQQQQQNEINAQMAQFQQAFTYPQQQLGMLESSLGMTPYETATSGSAASDTTATQSNPAGTAISAMQMLGGLASAPAGGTSALTGIGSFFGGLSDRRLKTDIKKIDTHPTGVPIYAYRYKGDPKTYPKVAGPMAEDVMKIAPHAVRPMGVGGRLAVHMPALDALAPGATPPSSPGIAGPLSALRSTPPGRLSPRATPPSSPGAATAIRMMSPALRPRGRAPIVGALGGG
jgi:hypothetical protein